MKWVNHFRSGSSDQSPVLVPHNEISVGHGLKDQRLFMMKAHASRMELGAVLMSQIKSLRDFLNVRTTLNEDQIGETAMMILDEFDDMSFTSITDCFNKIKRAQHPFNEKLYESLDGRKIMEYLSIYRMHQTEFLENAHRDRQQKSEYNLTALQKASPEVVQGLKDLSQELRKASLSRREKESIEISKMDKMIKGWILDFDKLKAENPKLDVIGQLDLYLKKRMDEFNNAKK